MDIKLKYSYSQHTRFVNTLSRNSPHRLPYVGITVNGTDAEIPLALRDACVRCAEDHGLSLDAFVTAATAKARPGKFMQALECAVGPFLPEQYEIARDDHADIYKGYPGRRLTRA